MKEENISVIFGDKEVKSVTYNNYDRITITVPSSSKPGPVTVRVKNQMEHYQRV